MRFNYLKARLKTAALVASVLLLGARTTIAQQTINLTAGPATTTLPDGKTVPMWGYSCTSVTGTAAASGAQTCAALNTAGTGSWSPILITVPSGQNLNISLTNNLTFGANSIPTSITIVGQVGGGLGTSATTAPSPDHTNAQSNVTWPIANNGGGTGTPPVQPDRVQSFSTEVIPGGTATTGQCPSPCSLTWTTPKPGTYLIESGTHPSIQGPMGLYGVLVVTTAPAGATPGTAYPAVGTRTAATYNAEVTALFSEIDPVQNAAVNTAVGTAGFKETNVWSGQPGMCGNPGAPVAVLNTCYPPAVNYTPLYYLINGVAFNKTSASASLFPVISGTATPPVTGTALVRLVNAGSRMHVPSIVGSQTGTGPTPPTGFSLVAEDGNPLPGAPRVQSEVFMAAGKTYDVAINIPAACVPVGTATTCVNSSLPIYDRELSLSSNAIGHDSGMLAYIGVNGSTVPVAPAIAAATANPDAYSVAPGQTLTVSDPSKGVMGNDINVYGVALLAPVTGLTFYPDGTFTYTGAGATFTYCGNGTTSGQACAQVTITPSTAEAGSGISMGNLTYTAKTATYLKIAPSGVLQADKDALGYSLTVDTATVAASSGLTLSVDPNGGFVATVGGAGTYSFTYKAKNSQGTDSASTATVTLVFPTASGLAVSVVDGATKAAITDYRWIIEEDRTFWVDPANTTNNGGTSIVPTFGTNFHTSYMPVIATGCTGTLSCESGQSLLGKNAVCDIGNGVCRTTATQETPLDPSQVALDPARRYYISVLPGDAANPFNAANLSSTCATVNGVSTCGHGMGGAPIAAACKPVAPATTCTGTFNAVTVLAQPTPFPSAKLSVYVFEDDFPLNGEQDAGGGIDILAPNEPGLGGFNITLFDDAGGTGDATGQMTYDMFNQPLSNSLAGTKDPATGLDACPISANPRQGANDPTQTGITGTIVTCPKYEAGGTILSPLAGQAVVANMMPGRYGVVATPAADRIARGEEWLQTNTLDGQKAHDSFLKIGEAGYFQEYGPAGYHVSIGFANPAIINSRLAGVCKGTDPNVTGNNCTNSVTGVVTTERMSRTPDERLYSSGDNSSFAFTQCYVSLGDPDGEDFAFTKCDSNGNFKLSGLPDGVWRITVFDQWNDMLVDGLSTPVSLSKGATTDMGQIAMNQWQANIYTTTFFDTNRNGVRDSTEQGLTLLPTNIRFRDGSYSNFNNTDLQGNAGFNEEFPLFSWYVIESDTTRYRNTGTHVVYDSGGPADGTCTGTTAPCGTSTIGNFMANTAETVPVPTNLRVPGAFYCATADCADVAAPLVAGGAGGSTGRVDPPWVKTEGWQGFSGQNNFLEFGKAPFLPGETGGIHGEVIYASTRPFDDPSLLIHTSWTPDVPGVTVNLYQEGTAADGSQKLTLVDTTTTSSWDDWAQGFRSDGMPNMNCPGQGASTGTNADLFYFTLFNQPDWLDLYSNVHNGTPLHTIPSNSQFKCFDGMHNWNQLQPAPYDGQYQFPSVTGIDPATGKPAGTNCKICTPDNLVPTSDPYYGTPILPPGKYVVEMIVPPGYELVKEEDKNILIGDNYIAPVTIEFPGLAGSVYILPDQAEIASLYNATNAQNPTDTFGRTTFPSAEGDTGSVEEFWPCVGASRVVPDYISLFPQSHEVAPFAGATRNLCDRKEVTLTDQASALAKFWIFTSTHVAAHFTGVITDDFTSEFDPFSPQFGEKFSPPNLPISIKDWSGNEVSRVYADQWGTYDGLTYSTWEVNPPNPTGYAPTMMVTCMNDPGTAVDPATGLLKPDPLFNPQYSQFCYEIPFMPGQTQYMDTPVVPTSAFAGAGYNNPDCNYPDATPAIAEVDGDSSISAGGGIGPWVSAAGHTLTIKALGDKVVPNNAYSGPQATTTPFNAKTITRHYGFGSATGKVTIGATSAGVPIPATVTGWTDGQITVTVPAGIPNCAIQQQSIYVPAGTTSTQCGELVVTTAGGLQSVDTVTVTVGGATPTHVLNGGSIQTAIDKANPGDLIIVNPGTYFEILLMWKPVRLQGVGAASSVINANPQPEGKMDPWRKHVNCLFGLAENGQPYSIPANLVTGTPAQLVPVPAAIGTPVTYEPLNVYDPTGADSCPATGWVNFSGSPNNPQVDRLPLEAVVGWDTTVNGNLAELLQEPSLMGAYEGAAITVLSKGIKYPAGFNTFGTGTDSAAGSNIAHEGQMPLGSVILQASDCLVSGKNPFPSNYMCNPSRIDGLGITDSSQGGGGIFVHAWGHNLEVSNNRIYNNTGTMTGGITVGQGESPDALLAGNSGDPLAGNINDPTAEHGGFDQQPWTCNMLVPGAVSAAGIQNVSPAGFAANTQFPYCFDINVSVHNNAITSNSSIGDELFSGTPAGAGGATFCTGSDYYKFNFNWVCGNMSTGDGGGLAHVGFTWHGDIEHNTVLFNQSLNPTISTNGGGIIIMGAAPDGTPAGAAAGTECGSVTDVDCQPGLPDGTGPGTVINANLIMGNSAESGSGGGLRLQSVNGTEIAFFPRNPNPGSPGTSPGWNSVAVTNNIIANNVAGWDGGGVSLQDALAVNFINNTVISNDSTASAGVLFNTIGAPVASAPGDTNQCQGGGTAAGGSSTNCNGQTSSAPQPAGLVSVRNSPNLIASLPATITCPTNNGTGGSGTGGLTNGNCRSVSYPFLANDVFWQNRSFYIGVGSLGSGTLNQQNVVALYNSFGTTQAPSQAQADATTGNGGGVIITGGTGACPAASYWDIGVRGDTGPGNHGSGFTLGPSYSVITDVTDYSGTTLHNSGGNPTFISQYCNGSRTPPEYASMGYQVPPGISDATVPNPIFNLTPAATVDEGNNWINMSWGPLAETGPVTGSVLGNYGPTSTSSTIGLTPSTATVDYNAAPALDFFNNPRKTNAAVDAGAVEYQVGTNTPLATVTGGPLAFGNVIVGTTSALQTLTVHSVGTANVTTIAVAITAPFTRATALQGGAGSCVAATSLAPGQTCTINVVFTPTAAVAYTGTATVTSNVPVTGSPVSLSGSGLTATHTATVTPSPLNLGLWPTGVASAPYLLTVTNTGNQPLATGTFTFNLATPFTRLTTGTFPAAAPNCGAALAVGASCTIKVVFTPTAAGAVSRTLAVAYAGATVTGSPVTINGTGTTTRSTVSVSPNPLTITLPTGSLTGTGTVTFTNTAAAGGANVTVSNVAVAGGSILTYFFSNGALAGPDNCTGTVIAPGTSCTVAVRFTNVLSARGVNRTGTMTFTDSGTTNPVENLIGHANP